MEESFKDVPGVVSTEVGYTGGHTENPTYEDVCSDETGHAEALKVMFNPKVVTYRALVEHFFRTHDPTTKNRQGPDVGSQYRSAVFTLTKEQEEVAHVVKDELEEAETFGNREIVTEITPATTFYRAEEYHQRYIEKTGMKTCRS